MTKSDTKQHTVPTRGYIYIYIYKVIQMNQLDATMIY